MAVSPLKSLSGAKAIPLGEKFAALVAKDLYFSGLFRLVDRSAFVEDPQTSGITLGEINFQDWSVIGAVALVKGSIALEGEGATVEVRLFDVVEHKQLGGKRYRGSHQDLRRMAHKFADEILYYLTGARGPFDSRIAYVSTAGGRFKEIYIMGLDGEELVPVSQNRTINLSPSWGPAAHTLLYTSYQKGRPDLYEVQLPAGTEMRIPLAGPALGGEWSPNGDYLAVSMDIDGNSDIYLLGREGKIIRRLTDHQGIDVSPAWSPDGRKIAFCSARSGTPQIYVMNADGSGLRRLTFLGSYNTSPAWSPKGDRIAYTGRVGGRFHIFTTSSAGGESHQLTAGPGDNEDPSWSPDGRYLVFSSTRLGSARLFVMDREGRVQRQLTTGKGDDTNPAWSPRLE